MANEFKYFPVNKVRLPEGTDLYAFVMRACEYYEAFNMDEILTSFDEGSLRGKLSGILSGLSLTYAATGNSKLRKKIEYLFAELLKRKELLLSEEGIREGLRDLAVSLGNRDAQKLLQGSEPEEDASSEEEKVLLREYEANGIFLGEEKNGQFQDAAKLLSYCAKQYPESCDTALMDDYEDILVNCLLATDGAETVSALPGSVKEIGGHEEDLLRLRLLSHIFAEDDENYYVNLLADATLYDLLEVRLKETATSVKVSVKALSNLKKNVMVRVPYWAAGNKKTHGARFSSGTGSQKPAMGSLDPMQSLMQANLKKGEELNFNLPAALRVVKTEDKKYYSYAKGQNLLAFLSDSKEYMTGDEAKKNLVPFTSVKEEAYHILFERKSE